MTEETKTVIRVFEKDAEKLKRIFGQPQWQAFHLALAKAPCDHPEGKRRYTTAIMRADEQAFNETEPTARMITLSGFRCMACLAYIFPGQVLDDGEYALDA